MPCRIGLVCEDAGHERFARALVGRLAAEEGVTISMHVLSARLGIPRLKAELQAFQAVIRRSPGVPDILVVLIDANSVGVGARRAEVIRELDPTLFPTVVIGCPDPCIERWLIGDPESFHGVFGVTPHLAAGATGNQCKARLVAALEEADEIVTQGGSEFADEIVEAMDLYRAGRAQPSLSAFIDDLRRALRRAGT